MRIRLIKQGDGEQLWQLIMAYLKETDANDGDFLPTLENATAFTIFAIQGAAVGDPCVVAEDNGKLVGFCLIRGIEMPGFQLRRRAARTWGTYVLPSHRQSGIAGKMVLVTARMSKMIGYECYIGMVMNSAHADHMLRLVERYPGSKVIGTVVMKDLRRLSEDAPSTARDDAAEPVKELH